MREQATSPAHSGSSANKQKMIPVNRFGHMPRLPELLKRPGAIVRYSFDMGRTLENPSRTGHNGRALWLRIAALVLLAACLLVVISIPFAVEGTSSPGAWYYAAISATIAALGIAAYRVLRRWGLSRGRALLVAVAVLPAPYAAVFLIVWIFVSAQS
jgi:hypothetical protein